MQLGATLAKQRANKKRTRDDMDDTEQKTLADYETGKAKKAKQDVTSPMLKPFRCRLLDQQLKCNATQRASTSRASQPQG